MNKRDKHIRSYTASDIRQYLDGKLSAAEMYALEKAAMDDPFLADAIEGMDMNDQHGHIPFETGLDDLKRRLQEKINQREKKNRVLPMLFRWQVAAAIGLLIISGAISYTFLIKKPATDKEISQNRKKEPAQDSIIPKISPAPAASEPAIETAPVAKNNLPERSDVKENNLATTSKSGAKKRRKQYETIKKPLPVNEEIASAEKIDQNRSIDLPAPEMAKSGTATAINSALQGKVAGVNIQSRGKNDKPDKIIQLQEKDNSLAEVVVTGYGIKKGKRMLSSQEASGAEPITGWAEYNQYLVKNKKITTADSSLQCVETISFLVHKNGALSHFRIEHSISPAHDAELIRLVKAGPAWKVLSGNKQRCRVSLSF